VSAACRSFEQRLLAALDGEPDAPGTAARACAAADGHAAACADCTVLAHLVAGQAAAFAFLARPLPSEELLAHHGKDGCHVWGGVEDIRTWLAAADLALVPLEIARGVQNKVLEAMAMQRAIVGTTRGCAGLGLKHGESAWIADESGGLVDGIITLLGDPSLRGVLAANARQRAERDFDWRVIGTRLRSMYHELLEERRCGISTRMR